VFRYTFCAKALGVEKSTEYEELLIDVTVSPDSDESKKKFPFLLRITEEISDALNIGKAVDVTLSNALNLNWDPLHELGILDT
jgi:hypothetical protein